MKCKLSEINPSSCTKVSVPDNIHFVWIGDVGKINCEYINIWQRSNQSKTINLWLDQNTFSCGYLLNCIQKHVFDNFIDNQSEVEMHIRNSAFKYIFPRLKKGLSFDGLVREFLFNHSINEGEKINHDLKRQITNSNIVIKDIGGLFDNEFEIYMQYYYYEVILRGNLASASDIIRLLILYKHGGIYIDVDTLPYTDYVYSRVNTFLKNENIVEDDFILLNKTLNILNKLERQNDPDYEDNYSNIASEDVVKTKPYGYKYHEIQRLIRLDVSSFSIDKIIPLGEVRVIRNLMAIGSLPRLKGIYFNHFIASHSESKSVRIILRIMKKRYKYLEGHNCIFEFYNGVPKNEYLSRILTWRSELITKNYCVTSVLTGPGLIIEVLLGLAYQLLSLEGVEPDYVAEFFQNEQYGIALYQHNLDTPYGHRSTWRE
uniref:TcdA/TcdB catalytic glycosyltransferase domain-containing protein n=1 Tax=Scandinavium goeteborgense TaxID=1851514 RepID=UPI001356E2E1|nr:TcdA/TcdB catalytic glycosyltransferase domain-containing protein [Scandinavium goeteborgense]